MFRTIQAFFLGVAATLAVQLCIYMTTQTFPADLVSTTQAQHIKQQITLICLALIPLCIPEKLIEKIHNHGKKQI